MSKEKQFGYGLDQKVMGMSVEEYLASLAEKNDKAEMETERINNGIKIAAALTRRAGTKIRAVEVDLKGAAMRSSGIDVGGAGFGI